MGFIQNGQMIAAANNVKATKKLTKEQAEAARRADQAQAQAASRQQKFERDLLEQMTFQSKALADIRDLMMAQQQGGSTSNPV
jgi:hypothetical protein